MTPALVDLSRFERKGIPQRPENKCQAILMTSTSLYKRCPFVATQARGQWEVCGTHGRMAEIEVDGNM